MLFALICRFLILHITDNLWFESVFQKQPFPTWFITSLVFFKLPDERILHSICSFLINWEPLWNIVFCLRFVLLFITFCLIGVWCILVLYQLVFFNSRILTLSTSFFEFWSHFNHPIWWERILILRIRFWSQQPCIYFVFLYFNLIYNLILFRNLFLIWLVNFCCKFLCWF